MPKVLDLEHLGLPGAIGSYLIVDPEPALIDPGPATTLDHLREALAGEGLVPGDLRHLFLTHVHLDHAGATGHLTREAPRAVVHIHEDGARHMVDPDRLVASARRVFGDDHDRLWGEMHPVPADRIRSWRPGEVTKGPLRPIASPGHIAHHLAWLDEGRGVLFAGDALGIILSPETPSHPPTPPPAVDLAAWRGTLAELAGIGAERAGVAHFGWTERVAERARELREALDALAERVADAMEAGDTEAEAERFAEEVRAAAAEVLPRERVDRYFDTFPARSDWAGMQHHLERIS